MKILFFHKYAMLIGGFPYEIRELSRLLSFNNDLILISRRSKYNNIIFFKINLIYKIYCN